MLGTLRSAVNFHLIVPALRTLCIWFEPKYITEPASAAPVRPLRYLRGLRWIELCDRQALRRSALTGRRVPERTQGADAIQLRPLNRGLYRVLADLFDFPLVLVRIGRVCACPRPAAGATLPRRGDEISHVAPERSRSLRSRDGHPCCWTTPGLLPADVCMGCARNRLEKGWIPTEPAAEKR